MREKSIRYMTYIIGTILLISLIINIQQYEEKEQLQENHRQCKELLEESYKNYKDLKSQFDMLYEQYFLLYENLTIINRSLYAYEEEVKDAITWFKHNADLKNSGLEESKLTILFNRCVKINQNKCYINLGCIEHMNSQEYIFGFDYKYDNETTTKQDKLLSLKEFVENEGGDCEDYALFYKAEFNYLKERCYKENAHNLVLLSFSFDMPQKPHDKKKDFFLENTETWYYPQVYQWYLKNYSYCYVVCGNIYDLNANDFVGHCMVAFSSAKINKPKDLQIYSAVIVEPQLGEVYGIIGKDINLTKDPYSQNNSIYYIITDEDQYIYSLYFEKWISYDYIKKILHNMKLKLKELALSYNQTKNKLEIKSSN